MRVHNDDQFKKVAILGSFGKHYDSIVETAKIFCENGIEVLVPKLNGKQDNNGNYILLVGDNSNNPKELEKDYIKKCLEADFVYVCNKDGYIGTTVAFELGILSCFRQEIFFMEKPSDDLFLKLINSPSGNIGDPETIVRGLNDEIELCRAREFFDNWYEPRGDQFQLLDNPLVGFEKRKINKHLK